MCSKRRKLSHSSSAHLHLSECCVCKRRQHGAIRARGDCAAGAAGAGAAGGCHRGGGGGAAPPATGAPTAGVPNLPAPPGSGACCCHTSLSERSACPASCLHWAYSTWRYLHMALHNDSQQELLCPEPYLCYELEASGGCFMHGVLTSLIKHSMACPGLATAL